MNHDEIVFFCRTLPSFEPKSWAGCSSETSWVESMNTQRRRGGFGLWLCASSVCWSTWRQQSRCGKMSRRTLSATSDSPVVKMCALTTSSPSPRPDSGPYSWSWSPHLPFWWFCMQPPARVERKGPERDSPSARVGGAGACGALTWSASWLELVWKSASWFYFTSCTMGSVFPTSWSVTWSLAPALWSASSLNPPRKPSSPSSWWSAQACALCWISLNWAFRFSSGWLSTGFKNTLKDSGLQRGSAATSGPPTAVS